MFFLAIYLLLPPASSRKKLFLWAIYKLLEAGISLQKGKMMLDIIHATKFFNLIGEKNTPEEENFTKVFILLGDLDRKSLATLMINLDVPWELTKAFCDLNKNEASNSLL